MSPTKGRFIVFEGGEGAGKTSVIEAVVKRAEEQGKKVVKTREPGTTVLGERIRALLLHSDGLAALSSKAELLLFLAARAQNIEEVIAPALASGDWVICDRFNASTIAYQGWARGLGVDEVDHLCTWVCGSIMPDLTIYLDIDPVVGLARASKVALSDRIESETIDFHARVRAGFHAIAVKHPDTVSVLNAEKPLSQVIDEAWNLILHV